MVMERIQVKIVQAYAAVILRDFMPLFWHVTWPSLLGPPIFNQLFGYKSSLPDGIDGIDGIKNTHVR